MLRMVAHAQEQLFNLAMLESTLFWTGLAFVILLSVVWKYVTPVMRDTLDKRAARIQDDIDRAARLRNEAQQALSEYESQLQTARKEAHEIVAKAKDEAEKLMTTKTTMLERDLARRSEDARVSIEQAKFGPKLLSWHWLLLSGFCIAKLTLKKPLRSPTMF